jgi:hypothetical protein
MSWDALWPVFEEYGFWAVALLVVAWRYYKKDQQVHELQNDLRELAVESTKAVVGARDHQEAEKEVLKAVDRRLEKVEDKTDEIRNIVASCGLRRGS